MTGATSALSSDEAVGRGLPAVFQRLVESITERPPADLDPDLDAAIRSFARRGIRHSSVPHIAQERGVSRATLYRRIGTVDDIARLVLIREVHLFLDSLPESGQTAAGPKGIIDTAVAIVRHVTEHPVFIKIMDDEPELIRDGIRFSASIIDVAVDAVTPFIDQEMEAGRVRKAPTATTAKLLIHLIIAGIITQPRDLEGHFTELMGPVLEP